jgi:hypothetical protein
MQLTNIILKPREFSSLMLAPGALLMVVVVVLVVLLLVVILGGDAGSLCLFTILPAARQHAAPSLKVLLQ